MLAVLLEEKQTHQMMEQVVRAVIMQEREQVQPLQQIYLQVDTFLIKYIQLQQTLIIQE